MAIPTFTLTVAGTSYTAAQRAAAGIHMGSLEMSLEAAYDQLMFTEVGPAAVPLHHPAQRVTLTRDSDSLVCFSGEITDLQWGIIPKGIGKAYTCLGLMYLADRVPSTWTDGTGTMVFNREPSDPYYTPSLAGLTVGEMLALALTVPFTATLLDSYGIGNYTSLSPPTLPATTVADLAAMTVVPAKPVTFQGESLPNQIVQFVPQWMPRFVMQLRPDGLFRFKDTTDIGMAATFIPRTMTLPGTTGVGDTGIQWPSISASTRECSTAVVMRGGPETEAAWLSELDGTLIEGWSGGDEAIWTITDFTQPKDAYDEGTITAVTSTSATVQSDDASVHWVINFWNGREANILMTNLVASGISQQETRIVTSNTALVAAGTSTINWDSSWPVTLTAYTRYRLVGTSGGLNEVGRLFYPCDPSTGDFGTNCYIGAHMVVRSATVVRVANNDKTFGEYFASTATICNSHSGSPPFVELPAVVEPVPALGAYRFAQPVVMAFASAATLAAGYPATSADGRPSEIRVLAMYSRGALSNQSPGSGFAGTAYTQYGLEATKYCDFPDWIWKQDTTSFGSLANEYLLSAQDIVWEGSVSCYEFPGAFDVLVFENAINFAMNGGTCPWTAMNAPQRSVKVDWGNGQEAAHFISLSFSSRRRPFSAESLYLHPQFAPGSPLTAVTEALSGMGGGYLEIGATGPGLTTPLLGQGGAINAGPALASAQATAMTGLTSSIDNQMASLGAGQIGGMVGISQGIANQMSGGMASGGQIDPSIMGVGMGGEPSRAGEQARAQRRAVDLANRNRQDAPRGERESRDWQASMTSMHNIADTDPTPIITPLPGEGRRLKEQILPRRPLFVGPPISDPKTNEDQKYGLPPLSPRVMRGIKNRGQTDAGGE